MKTSIIIFAAALGAAAAAPAIAASDSATTTFSYDAKHDKYCVSDQITGRRIAIKDCRSKADWAAAGVLLGENSAKETQTKLAQK